LRVSAAESTRATWLRVAAAAGSGALLALSRPPVDIGPLACIGLVPLFIAWRDRRPRATAGYAFLAGVVYYALVCSWVWYFGAVAMVPLLAALAGYWAAAGALIGWLRARGLSNPWLTAAIWICADALVARFPFGGLSWGEIGYAFHDVSAARAVASVGGVTFVTYLAVALNALLADLIVNRRATRAVVHAAAGVVVVFALVGAATVTRATPPVAGRLRVAVVQGNDKDRELTDAEEAARYLPKSHFALASRITDPVDLIVFPESSMDADPRTDPYIHSNLVRIARQHNAYVLANATVDADPSGKKASNLDVLFAPDGTIIGTYAKRHLVPFGEYIPFRSLLEPHISEIKKVPRDFQPGHTTGLFPVNGTRVGTLICFESAFGYQVRPLVRDGAEVLVVSTNNRSYRRSANSAQHLAIGQMRAAETGRPLVQAAISGISGFVDAKGAVRDTTNLFDRTVVESTIVATTGQTPYVRYGEWVLGVSVLIVGSAVIIGLVRRRREAQVEAARAAELVSVETRIVAYERPESEQPAPVPDTADSRDDVKDQHE
jgi:apolipoprotein N-acyltransferase